MIFSTPFCNLVSRMDGLGSLQDFLAPACQLNKKIAYKMLQQLGCPVNEDKVLKLSESTITIVR